MPAKKTFVLDTNVLLHSPDALFNFDDNHVVIPEAVVEEIDNFKSAKGDIGYGARETIRLLESFREDYKLTDGIPLPNNGTLRVERNNVDVALPPSWSITKPDNRILQTCIALRRRGESVFLVTKDVSQRIKAEIVDIVAQDYQTEQSPNINNQYSGRAVIENVSEDLLNLFYANGEIPYDESLYENQYVTLKSSLGNTALGIYKEGFIKKLLFSNSTPYGVHPRNTGQRFCIDALMRNVDDAPLIIIKGSAGTAKTFLSLAVGMEKVSETNENDREFRRILLCRPNILTEDIGFLPGTEKDKIMPLFRPVFDNLETLIYGNKINNVSSMEIQDNVLHVFNTYIKVESIGYLRGRSINNHYLLIDEAQNLTPSQVKSIITRAGSGTKIILAGDPEQVDHPFLDSRTNGLSYASEAMKGHKLVYQINFLSDECQRSSLAKIGAKLL